MTSCFDCLPTPLAGLWRIQRKPTGDARGWFERLFCAQELADAGFRKPVSQINRTLTAQRGTARGLHFQYPPHAEEKLIACLRGAVFDVVVDLRTGSPTFLHWHAETLSAENHVSLLVPHGFAHGFQTLMDDCEMLYAHTTAYVSEAEGGVHVQDAKVNVAWPLPIIGLSARDTAWPRLNDAFGGIQL